MADKDGESMNRKFIVAMPVDSFSMECVVKKALKWGVDRSSRYICVANVHMIMEAFDSRSFSMVTKNSDVVVPDGMPLVWMLKLLGERHATRVRGPDLMPVLCREASRIGLNIGFYGGRQDVLDMLCIRLIERVPGVKIVYQYSPPFRELTDDENSEIVKNINEAEVQILFVGLGCPKQERWMAERRGIIKAVMLGVGAAFDMYAGKVRECPCWLQSAGLEWMYRFIQEPKRLWKRYLLHNPRFVVLACLQLVGFR